MTWREPAAGPVKLTYDDLVLLPDDGLRHEIVDGEHVVSAAPNTRHQRLVLRIAVAMGAWLAAHDIGELFTAPFDVVFTRHDVVEPDLLFISHERAATQLNDRHATGADLVIEVVSPATRGRDESLKRALYERGGVAEYWCVDPDRDLVRVYRRAAGNRFAAALELTSARSGVLRTPVLPAFELELATLFRR